MKANITKDSEKKDIKFPCIMKGKDFESVIIVDRMDGRRHYSGMCIIAAPEAGLLYEVGTYADNWDISSFEPFDGEITLSNE